LFIKMNLKVPSAVSEQEKELLLSLKESPNFS
jgi:hypothetical protein